MVLNIIISIILMATSVTLASPLSPINVLGDAVGSGQDMCGVNERASAELLWPVEESGL